MKQFRNPGDSAWFEYHCNESHSSPDAPLWYHSHQKVEILGLFYEDKAFTLSDNNDIPETKQERLEQAIIFTYRIRFDDGLEWDAFEDELFDNPNDFEHPNIKVKPSRVIIIVENGVIQEIFSDNENVEVFVKNWDDIDNEENDITNYIDSLFWKPEIVSPEKLEKIKEKGLTGV